MEVYVKEHFQHSSSLLGSRRPHIPSIQLHLNQPWPTVKLETDGSAVSDFMSLEVQEDVG